MIFLKLIICRSFKTKIIYFFKKQHGSILGLKNYIIKNFLKIKDIYVSRNALPSYIGDYLYAGFIC